MHMVTVLCALTALACAWLAAPGSARLIGVATLASLAVTNLLYVAASLRDLAAADMLFGLFVWSLYQVERAGWQWSIFALTLVQILCHVIYGVYGDAVYLAYSIAVNVLFVAQCLIIAGTGAPHGRIRRFDRFGRGGLPRRLMGKGPQ